MTDVKFSKPAKTKASKPTFFDRVATLADMVLSHPKNDAERKQAERVKQLMSREAKHA